jgi:hypothetical protein
MRTSFHHQPEAQHPNFQLSTSWQADYPIFTPESGQLADVSRLSALCPNVCPAVRHKMDFQDQRFRCQKHQHTLN